MTGLEKGILIASLAAVVGAVASAVIAAKLTSDSGKPLSNGVTPPNTTGSDWTNIGTDDNYQMTPQQSVYNGPGHPHQRTSANGQIFVQKFRAGGNHNSPVNYEQSYAFQTSTKNPYAQGTNNSYAWAVNRAAQDPTNQATALVYGPGIAPNDVS